MVCLQHDCVQIFQMFHGIIVILSKICCDCNGFFPVTDPVSGRFICIVRDFEWFYFQLTQCKCFIRLDFME